ncbi:MAG: phosphotransferase [Caldilineaceae bacterium]
MHIPDNASSLTPEWLTQTLRAAGVIEWASVTAIERAALSNDQGVTGQLVRLRLTYDRNEQDAPSSIIAKFPTSDPQVRDFIFTVTRHYQRESFFYQELANKVVVRVAQRYYSAVDVDAQKIILLIEDLAPAQTLDKIAGCPPQAAARILRALAYLHAQWWEQPELADLTAIAFDSPSLAQQAQSLYREAWELLRAKIESRLPAAFVNTGEWLADHLAAIYNRLQKAPRTLLHRDVAVDNLLFAPSNVDADPIFIDWQMFSVGRGAQDAAYLIGRGMTPAERRHAAEELLRLYWTTLTGLGVQGYSFAQCLDDYRLALYRSFAEIVISSAHADMSEQQAHTVYEVLVPRHIEALLEHDVSALF